MLYNVQLFYVKQKIWGCYVLQSGNIEVELGCHPQKDQVQLDWESFPARVDPGRGGMELDIAVNIYTLKEIWATILVPEILIMKLQFNY